MPRKGIGKWRRATLATLTGTGGNTGAEVAAAPLDRAGRSRATTYQAATRARQMKSPAQARRPRRGDRAASRSGAMSLTAASAQFRPVRSAIVDIARLLSLALRHRLCDAIDSATR